MNFKDEIKRRIKYLLFFVIIGVVSLAINNVERGSNKTSMSSVENIKIIVEVTNITLIVGMAGIIISLIMLLIVLTSSQKRNNNNPIGN